MVAYGCPWFQRFELEGHEPFYSYFAFDFYLRHYTQGGDFLGVTEKLLDNNPGVAEALRLDVIYPVNGFKRCYQPEQGYEFLYPVGSRWILSLLATSWGSHNFIHGGLRCGE
jgi:hypothetical protein